jgi:hypothetical protein
MIRLHPRSIKLRHLVAPLFVASILALAIASIFWRPARWLLLAEIITYLIGATVAGWQAAKRSNDGLGMVLLMPLIFATIHLSWGSSFLVRLLKPSST